MEESHFFISKESLFVISISVICVFFFWSQNQVTFHYAYLFLLEEISDIPTKVKVDKSKDLIVQLPQLVSRDISFLQNTIINFVINYICC